MARGAGAGVKWYFVKGDDEKVLIFRKKGQLKGKGEKVYGGVAKITTSEKDKNNEKLKVSLFICIYISRDCLSHIFFSKPSFKLILDYCLINVSRVFGQAPQCHSVFHRQLFVLKFHSFFMSAILVKFQI